MKTLSFLKFVEMLVKVLKHLLCPCQREQSASILISWLLAPRGLKSKLELLFPYREKTDSEHNLVCEIENTRNR